MLDQFKARIEISKLKAEDAMEEERDYLEILARHRQRLPHTSGKSL
jgi:hypothetical protein